MKVLKFGGTSVGSAERIKALTSFVSDKEPKIVVLSAMSGTTNQLVAIGAALLANNKSLAKELANALENDYLKTAAELYSVKEYSDKAIAFIKSQFNFIRSFSDDVCTAQEEKSILAQGELLSTTLFYYYLLENKHQAVLLSALDFMRIDINEEPELNYIEEKLSAEIQKHPGVNLFITQGYICRNAFGEVDNLKRGGSDYSASLIGAAINASEIQIWTDIDGMHNNDPRIVDDTYPIAELSFDEAAELAYFGAKILHPSSVLPARLKNIPVRLLNTMQPKAKGTLISSASTGENIKAVAAKDGITAIKIKSGRMLLAYGFLRAVFEIFERYRTPIDMITTSEVAVSLTIDNTSNLKQIISELEEFGTVTTDSDQAIVCVVGDFIAEKPGYALRVFDSLKNIPLRMISYGGSKNNISVLIHSDDKSRALNALNKGLFSKKAEPVN